MDEESAHAACAATGHLDAEGPQWPHAEARHAAPTGESRRADRQGGAGGGCGKGASVEMKREEGAPGQWASAGQAAGAGEEAVEAAM